MRRPVEMHQAGLGVAKCIMGGFKHSVLGMVSRKKVAVLLDFVQMRGGRALPKFLVQFSQTDKLYIGSIWGWGGGGGDPCPIFFCHIGVQKKWYKLSKLGGVGGR